MFKISIVVHAASLYNDYIKYTTLTGRKDLLPLNYKWMCSLNNISHVYHIMTQCEQIYNVNYDPLNSCSLIASYPGFHFTFNIECGYLSSSRG